MTDLFTILVGIVLVNDLVLDRHFGPCPYLRPAATARGGLAASLAIALALVAAGLLSGAVDAWVLRPLDHRELRIVAATLAAVIVVPALEAGLVAASQAFRAALPSPWPAQITVNATFLAAALVGADKFAEPVAAVRWAAGAGIAFGAVMMCYAELRRRLADGDVPVAFQGAAIALVTGSLCALALGGLAGLLRG